MRQTPMDRWMETAETKRVNLIAQGRARPTEETPIPLLTRLRSMVLPEISHHRQVDARLNGTPYRHSGYASTLPDSSR